MKGLRPDITPLFQPTINASSNNFFDPMNHLVSLCWDHSPSTRPSFEQILNFLDAFVNLDIENEKYENEDQKDSLIEILQPSSSSSNNSNETKQEDQNQLSTLREEGEEEESDDESDSNSLEDNSSSSSFFPTKNTQFSVGFSLPSRQT